MVESAYELACLKELDAMIGRAVAACDRYRQATEQWGLSAPTPQPAQASPDHGSHAGTAIGAKGERSAGVVPWAKDKEKAA